MKTYGFSLLEVLIVLSIVAILAAIAFPSYQTFVANNQQHMISSQLLRAISLTRMEAVTRETPVILCSSADRKTCGGHWLNGYIVISDNKVLYRFHHPTNKGILNWRAARGLDQVEFSPSGFSVDNGTFWFCPEKSTKPAWAIVLNKTGRARFISEEQLENKSLTC